MFASVILLLLASLGSSGGKIATVDKKNWWKYTEIYEIYIRSFMDSDGDGIGDLKGITMKLDHFKELQIGAIWITPFYESPQSDMGYDISNFTNVDPIYGTLKDFDELVREAKKKGLNRINVMKVTDAKYRRRRKIMKTLAWLGIRVIVDMVINHSSDEHVWFRKSVEKLKPYDEYYVWQDAKGYDNDGKPILPNNWKSIFGGSMWEWNDQRRQFYLHQFNKKQPDLNLRNDKVKNEIKKILNFWFNRGVNGLRMDAVAYFIEDSKFRDEPLLNPLVRKDSYDWIDYNHCYTKNLWQNYEIIYELRQYIDQINKKEGGYDRMMAVEVYANQSATLAYYGTDEYSIAQYPLNVMFVTNNEYYDSRTLHGNITEWLNNLPGHGVPTWMSENHDRPRIGSKFVEEYQTIMNTLVMLLPGVACIYYGQEIGMNNGLMRSDQRCDQHGNPDWGQARDAARTPMQWDNSSNAGFTQEHKSWLPVNPNYWHLNVEVERKTANSYYNIFKDLSYLRKTHPGKYGKFNSYVISNWVYAFTRSLKGYDTFVIIMNLGTETEVVNLTAKIPRLSIHLKVLVASINSGYQKGHVIKKRMISPHFIILRPLSVVVLCSATYSGGCILK